jgi:hypothetical protein
VEDETGSGVSQSANRWVDVWESWSIGTSIVSGSDGGDDGGASGSDMTVRLKWRHNALL